MNVTELARILQITPQELRDSFPKLGFDIGQKAIKINRNVASKIIKDWPQLKRRLDRQRIEEEKEKEELETKSQIKKSIEIPKLITVREFAQIINSPVNIVLAELMKSGIFTSLNERIDFETAWLVGSELGIEVKQKKEDENKSNENEKNTLKNILAKEKKESLLARPPVIVVMGHVDHGKTKLLDAIRETNVIDQEAGGITQHIGAYQVTRKNQLITFIDTPGHEAFTAMRSRGARIADVAILVVAADDGVKPQTLEAFKIIEVSKIPFVVAINKIDKPEANIDKTKQELSTQLNITPEEWGGKIICAPISALAGEGIDDLLDMVLLTAESETENIKANPEAQATGTIIESHVDKGAGPVATILVQNGTLKTGDELLLNKTTIGKVRLLSNYRGKKINSAGPSSPAQIIGLKIMPKVGDIIQVGKGEKMKFKKQRKIINDDNTQKNTPQEENENIKKINFIIKSDVLGSAEAIEESLEKINTEEINVKIIFKGLGNITEGDIKRAEASGGIILGFNVKTPPVIEELARERNIKIRSYSIIYDLINDVKTDIEKIIEPNIKRIDLGKIKVMAIFRTEKKNQIIGGKVIEGKIEADAKLEIERSKDIVGEGKITRLQSGKENVTSVEENQDCGLQCDCNTPVEEGDKLIIYKEKITKKSI